MLKIKTSPWTESLHTKKNKITDYTYKVRWKCYQSEEGTWEKRSSVNDLHTISSYWRSRDPTKKKKMELHSLKQKDKI